MAITVNNHNILSIQNRVPIPFTYKRNTHLQTQFSKSGIHSTTSLPTKLGLTTTTTTTTALSCVANSTVADVEVQRMINPITKSTSTPSWSEFAEKVSGEWDGFGADFTTQGSPIELPDKVVPEAYREWEVKVFDWQTQCPTLAQPLEFILSYKTIRLLPTVGCEADAATRYSIDERNIGGLDSRISAFAYQSSGCYVAVWPISDHGTYKLLDLEHCLINPQDRESRVRIIQVVRVADTDMKLENVKVFVEQWYGPFRNGDQLGGCAIRDSAFASTPAIEASQVVGVWQGPKAVASFNTSLTNSIQELKDGEMQKSVRDEHDLILLPKQLWGSLKRIEHGRNCCEVGWLYSDGCAITSKCTFSEDGELKEISVARETTV